METDSAENIKYDSTAVVIYIEHCKCTFNIIGYWPLLKLNSTQKEKEGRKCW